MPLYALEDLDDALDVTRSFLTPVDRTAWAKLAVVVLFVGGPGGAGLQYVAGGGADRRRRAGCSRRTSRRGRGR